MGPTIYEAYTKWMSGTYQGVHIGTYNKTTPL